LRELEQRTLATVLERSAETTAIASPHARIEAAEHASERSADRSVTSSSARSSW